MNAKIKIKNYKLHESVEVEFKSGNMYFVLGPNGVGKTSFSQAIFDISEGTSSNKQKLTHNKQSGYVAGTFQLNGADGESYQVIMDFKQGGADKFTITLPDGTKSNRKGDIADIFKYNTFTVDEFFAWGLTADGRRKQAEMFMKMLPEQVQVYINNIDAEINSTKGTMFLERRDIKRDIERVEAVVKTFVLSELEKSVFENGSEWSKTQEKLKEDLAAKKVTKASQAATEISNKALKDAHNNAIESRNEVIRDRNLRTAAYDRDIASLKEQLAAKERESNLFNTTVAKTLTEKEEAITTAQKEYTVKYVEIGEIDLEPLQNEIMDNEGAINSYKEVVDKVAINDKSKETLVTSNKLYDELTKAIEKKREEKKDLIQEHIKIKGISFEDGELMYIDENNVVFPFNEKNISYSAGGIIVFELMAAINKTLPIWVIGKASEYDDEKIQYFVQRAKDLDGVIIGDYVDKSATEFKIEVVDETKY